MGDQELVLRNRNPNVGHLGNRKRSSESRSVRASHNSIQYSITHNMIRMYNLATRKSFFVCCGQNDVSTPSFRSQGVTKRVVPATRPANLESMAYTELSSSRLVGSLVHVMSSTLVSGSSFGSGPVLAKVEMLAATLNLTRRGKTSYLAFGDRTCHFAIKKPSIKVFDGCCPLSTIHRVAVVQQANLLWEVELILLSERW